MPRLARLARVMLPEYPHHIVQRGHNRQLVFVEAADFERCLADLWELNGCLACVSVPTA